MGKGEWQCATDGCDDEREAGGVYCRDCREVLRRQPTSRVNAKLAAAKVQRQRGRYESRKAAGRCRYGTCQRPAHGHSMCAVHLERQRQWSAEYRKIAREARVCRCGETIRGDGWACAECKRVSNIARRARDEKARDAGRCPCGKPLWGARHCRACMDRRNAAARKRGAR